MTFKNLLGAEPDARRCGACQACCEAKAVLTEIEKPQWQRCHHQCAGGCAIYEERPVDCADYMCAWLMGLFGEDDRPDRSGVIVDVLNEETAARGYYEILNAIPEHVTPMPAPGRGPISMVPLVFVAHEVEAGALRRHRIAARIIALAMSAPVLAISVRAEVQEGPVLLMFRGSAVPGKFVIEDDVTYVEFLTRKRR